MDARRVNIEQTAISVTLKLAKFLHTIPHPGTSAFSLLRDSLLEFGLSWKSVSFENRSARLGDAVLKFNLFRETVSIKMFVDQVEVSIGTNFNDTLPQVGTVLVRLGEILQLADTEARVSEVDVLVRAHFTLPGSDADAHLNEFLPPRHGASADAFGFRIEPESKYLAMKGRLTIARSTQISGGLFAEWAATLSDFPELPTVTSRTAGEFVRVMRLFRLDVNEDKDAA